jgi:hypothetical protein
MRGKVLGVIAITCALAGCTAPNVVVVDATASPSAAATTTTPAPAMTAIPASAFLAIDDLGPGGKTWDKGVVSGPVWLHPCATAVGPPAIYGERAVVFDWRLFEYGFSGRIDPFTNQIDQDGQVYEVISYHRPGGAEAYLAEIRRLVTVACPRWDIKPVPGYEDMHLVRSYAIVAERFAGDDALLISDTLTGQSQGRPFSDLELHVIIRIGDVVVILDVTNGGAGNIRAETDRLVTAALARVASLRP